MLQMRIILDLNDVLEDAASNHVALHSLGEHGGLTSGLTFPDIVTEIGRSLYHIFQFILYYSSAYHPLWKLVLDLVWLRIVIFELCHERWHYESRPVFNDT